MCNLDLAHSLKYDLREYEILISIRPAIRTEYHAAGRLHSAAERGYDILEDSNSPFSFNAIRTLSSSGFSPLIKCYRRGIGANEEYSTFYRGAAVQQDNGGSRQIVDDADVALGGKPYSQTSVYVLGR